MTEETEKTVHARRKNTRMKSASYVQIIEDDGSAGQKLKMKNWSLAGLCLEVEPDTDMPSPVKLQKPKFGEPGPVFTCDIIWREGDEIGVKFKP